MRAIEAAAIASGAVTGRELMERAGAGVVAAVLAEWPELAEGAHSAVVLCGPGNNGGDGFVVARLLKERGWAVRVLFSGDPARLPPDAAANHAQWVPLGAIEPLDEETLRSGRDSDIYVDAIFGAGLTRPVAGDIAEALTHMNGRNGDLAYYQPRLIAVDAPSGLCLDSGMVPGQTRSARAEPSLPARCALTVTFHAPKVGHFLGYGPQVCGKLVVADIGLRNPDLEMAVRRHEAKLRAEVREKAGTQAKRTQQRNPPIRLVPPRDDSPSTFSRMWLPVPLLAKHGQHKFDYGHAVVVSGPAERSGAARLAARAALRVGAGLVTLAAPASSAAFIAPALTAVMLRGIRDADDLAEWLAADDRISALVIGPGLGLDDRAGALVAAGLAARRKTVLDADALTLIARDPALRAAVHKDCVLTPHGGEFARLWPDLAQKLVGVVTPRGLKAAEYTPQAFADWQASAARNSATLDAERAPLYSKLDAARDAAQDIGATVLFKGPDTVIASPSGGAAIHAAVYDRAAPWLATAGSGDVLAGLIAGLMARGFWTKDAAETAAYLHVEAARAFGPGLIAEDLPEMLPKVLRDLGVS
jgi:hydroxyethylthiazole kinase-like uncharacterized protein yjeF